MILDETTLKILGAVGILFLSFVVSKIGSKVIRKIHRRRTKGLRKSPLAKLYSNVITTIAIVITLFFLRIKITEDFFVHAYNLIPDLLSFVLLIILVIIIVNSIMTILEKIIEKSGITSLVQEYEHGFFLNILLAALRIFLYAILGIFALNSIGFANEFSRTVGYIIYPIFILFLAIIFFGVKDFISNFFSGMYIKNSPMFQLGQRIKFGDVIGTIEDINNNSVMVSTDTGYKVNIPNHEFLNKEISFKEIKTDIPTLESLKNSYVAQTASNCGPASAAMILDIFGHHFTQEKIAETAGTAVGKGTHPNKLIKSVQKLTKNSVTGAWIDIDNINDLREEVIYWLNDGALVVVDYKKSYLFPDAKKAHYSIVLAVEGDEFVILDPSSKKGGVYLADYRNIEKGMDTFSELIQGKRGYLVFAPRDSRAYNRLKKGLIYSDIDLYSRLNRGLKREFNRIMQKTEILEDLLPKRVKEFIEKHNNRERISRVWRPQPRVDDNE